MTFPRVQHADYFSDSGPVDGTVLVNSHSDAIEALQATKTLFADSATIASTTGANGQLSVAKDSFYNAQVWDSAGSDGPNWYGIYAKGSAILTGSGVPAVAGLPAGALAVANSSGWVGYAFDGAAWHAIGATDTTARDAAAAAQAATNALLPFFGNGDPVTTSAPTDGTHYYYFDYSTTPFTMWVLSLGDGWFRVQ